VNDEGVGWGMTDFHQSSFSKLCFSKSSQVSANQAKFQQIKPSFSKSSQVSANQAEYDSSTQGAFQALSTSSIQSTFNRTQGTFDLTQGAFKALSTYNESTYGGFNRR
jgi:hypothetical protein